MCFICVSHRLANGEHKDHIDFDSSDEFVFTSSAKDTSSGALLSTQASINTDAYINTIISGPTWSGAVGQAATVTYSFSTAGISSSLVYASGTYRSFTFTEQIAARQAMDSLSDITNLTFQQSASPYTADIQFYVGELGAFVAGITGYYYTYSNRFTDAAIGIDDDLGSLNQGTYGYETLLHELGHAVGLKHPGNYSYFDEGPYLPSNLDNTDNTIMSYNDTGIKTDYQVLDIAALEYLYGTKGSSSSGGSTAVSTDGDGISSTNNLDAIQNDNLSASLPSDMKGGLGSDTLSGSFGNDTMYGGRRISDLDDYADALYGNAGHDLMYGNSGNDTIYGDDSGNAFSGNDTIFGGVGNDVIYGGKGDDELAGGGGVKHPEDEPDEIHGGEGNDYIIANGSNDTVYGDSGNDSLYGGLGDDVIYGGAGDDFIMGQFGNEALSGGSGSDTFQYYSSSGTDTISDFDLSSDLIKIGNFINNSTIVTESDMLTRLTQQGGGTLIDLGEGNSIFLTGITSSNLSASHFDIFS